MKPNNDREAITLILDGLTAKGYKVTEVADDDWQPDVRTPASTVAEAVDLVTAVDVAWVFLTTPSGESGYIFFVQGNEPEEVACDYTVNLDPDLENIVSPWWG